MLIRSPGAQSSLEVVFGMAQDGASAAAVTAI